MKKGFYFVAIIFIALAPLKAFAINYTINFTGTGASSIVNSVIVQNLTHGTSVTVPSGNVLNLSDGLNAVEQVNGNDETIRVYPTSVDGMYKVSFFAKQAGSTQINAFSIDGRKVARISTDLQTGSNSFELSLPKGSFVIQVMGNEYTYTIKMLNPTSTQGSPKISYNGTEEPVSLRPQKSKSFTLGITTMIYSAGDRLLYKAVSGKCGTIVTDVPSSSKTTNFDFAECKDADGNYYTVVTIGTQTWMAENLNATKYRTGESIFNITESKAWATLSSGAWSDYNNDAINGVKYGKLYNWYAVSDARNIAPIGWHVATDAEWTTLENNLIANGGNFDGSTTGNKYAKSLASNADWLTSVNTGTIGNDLTKNNSSGFSANPGGERGFVDGAFVGIGSGGLWWSSTQTGNSIWARDLYSGYSNVLRYNDGVGTGLSVRCVKNYSVPNTSITDIDGNIYHAVTIGTQVWMVENLKTTKYRNGENIPNVTDNTAWARLSTGAWCDYDNSAANGTKYGKLYNWYAVADDRKLAPTGWHIPSNAEWVMLEDYLIANGYNYNGSTSGDRISNNKIGKALAATTDWLTTTGTGNVGYNLSKNNSSGFSGLPGGCRNFYPTGNFSDVGYNANWWSSSEADSNSKVAWDRGLYYGYSGTDWGSSTERYGFSVRCIRDTPFVP